MGKGVSPTNARAGHARPLRLYNVFHRAATVRCMGGIYPLPNRCTVKAPPPCRGRTCAARSFPAGAPLPYTRGLGAWRRTTSAASSLREPARAVVCPAGANIARSPVSPRSTVAPRSQPRNARPAQTSTLFSKNNLANGRIICYDYKLKTCSVPTGHSHIEQRESF